MGTFELITIGFPLSTWWCLRQYYRAGEGKDYYPASAATVVLGGMAAASIAVIDGVPVVGLLVVGFATVGPGARARPARRTRLGTAAWAGVPLDVIGVGDAHPGIFSQKFLQNRYVTIFA
jgi:hypothetical protein